MQYYFEFVVGKAMVINMGGFTYNGFGAADSYYPLGNVGKFQCNGCRGKERDFVLYELRMKIRLLYIPTVTINTKYAVCCSHCKNGFIVDEATKNKILNGSIIATVQNGALSLAEKEKRSNPEKKDYDNAVVSDIKETAKATKAVTSVTDIKPKEAKQPSPSPHVQRQPVNIDVKKMMQCPDCRMLFSADKQYCPICGKELIER